MVLPVIGTKLTDAFNINRNKAGLKAILDFAEGEEKLKNLPGTVTIKAVIAVIKPY